MTAPKFVFNDHPTFSWPVKVRYPGEGQIIEATFTAEFKAQDEDEMFADAGALSADDGEGIVELIANDRKRLKSVLIGWSDIAVDGGGEFEFTHANIDKLLLQRPVRLALGVAYAEAMLDRDEARVKN